MNFWSSTAWMGLLTLRLPRSVSLGKLTSVSVPRVSHPPSMRIEGIYKMCLNTVWHMVGAIFVFAIIIVIIRIIHLILLGSDCFRNGLERKYLRLLSFYPIPLLPHDLRSTYVGRLSNYIQLAQNVRDRYS